MAHSSNTPCLLQRQLSYCKLYFEMFALLSLVAPFAPPTLRQCQCNSWLIPNWQFIHNSPTKQSKSFKQPFSLSNQHFLLTCDPVTPFQTHPNNTICGLEIPKFRDHMWSWEYPTISPFVRFCVMWRER